MVQHVGAGSLGYDNTESIFRFGQMVWDANVLTWVRATQAGGSSGGGGAVTVADGADVAQGTTTDAEATGSGSVIAILKRIRTLLGGTLTTSATVSNFPATQAVSGTFWQATQPVSGPLTDAQIRATALPVSGAFFQATQPVSGPLTDTQLRASALAVTGTFFQATQPVSGTFWQATQPVSGTVTITPPTLTKGTQGSTGVSTQDLKDAGRNLVAFHMTIPVVTTATDALQSLTGYKSGAAVATTTTPAVVTAGKTFRVTSITITYVAIATAGSVKFTLRANTGGVVALASAAVAAWVVGAPAAAAGVSQTSDVPFPEGLEFAAGTGIGVSMVGLGATQAAAAVGYGQIVITGFEY